MQDIRQCRRCRKLFNRIASPYCPACIEAIDNEYRLVRDYIYDHPHAGIQKIAEDTEVSERTILQLLREGRLELDAGNQQLSCERCGTSIGTGRYCDSCQNRLSSELRSAQRSIGDSLGHNPDQKPGPAAVDRRNKATDKDSKDYGERMHSRNN